MRLKNIKGNSFYIRGGTNTGVYVFNDKSVLLIDPGLPGVRPKNIIRDLENQKKIAENDLKDLKTDIADLKKKINKSDTVEYIEKIAREELDMIKPHEIIYKDKNKQKSEDILH